MKFNTLENLAEFLDGTPWEKGEKRRIYFNGYGRDIKAWLEFESDNFEIEKDTGIILNSSLKVFSDCEQSRSWLINRSKQVKFEIMEKLHAITGLEICSTWQEVIL